MLTVVDIGCPQGEVITKELKDEGGILVVLLREGIELSDSLIEGVLGELAGLGDDSGGGKHTSLGPFKIS